jgi:ABC-2 type transport system ATP-binding protein
MIAARALGKTYRGRTGQVVAVSALDLTVEAGEFFGLLGPNGAGKSTTIGMLTTLVKPTAGRAYVGGHDVMRDPVGVRRCVGVVSQSNSLDNALSISDNLVYRGRYFGMRRRVATARADQLLEMFGLTERRAAAPRELSGGQARRAMIARAIMHRPEVLFLDEPTVGLDVQTRALVWDVLRGLHADGQTIVLTSHYLQEIESLCGRVAIIDHGAVLACDTVDELVADTAPTCGQPRLETVFLALTGRGVRE